MNKNCSNKSHIHRQFPREHVSLATAITSLNEVTALGSHGETEAPQVKPSVLQQRVGLRSGA
jgi:hypothetical protein